MTNRYDNALKLRSIITTHGTGGQMDDIEFRLLRSEFFDDPATKRLLPSFVRDSVTGDDVWAYLKDFHTCEGAYAALRKHITTKFRPLMDFLSDSGAPADAGISDTLMQYDADGVSD